MVLAFTFVKLLTVTPVPDTVTPVAAPRFVPVMVTGTVAPRAPLFGEMPVTAGARTVKALLRVAMPLTLVTETFLAPVPAVAVIVNVAVMVLAFTTLTLLTLTPRPDTVTTGVLDPMPVPVMVTFTAVPRTPEFGETPVTAGAAMVNVTALLVPPGVVTVTFLVPFAARRPIWKVAVTVVELTTVTPLTVTPKAPPRPLTLTDEAPVRFVPVRVTWMLVDR
jgi:hypothetical protein